jgi:hypothetical protein
MIENLFNDSENISAMRIAPASRNGNAALWWPAMHCRFNLLAENNERHF